jgi:hypothetical protein
MNSEKKLPAALFSLRLSVFVVMFMWTLDKFLNPDHAGAVFANFYFITVAGDVLIYIVGTIEMFIIIAFLLGCWKKWTYGAVLILHAVSTLSSYKQYLSPYVSPNLLFFAALPMLAACFTLYSLRDRDTLFIVGKK